jgi:hypothetical protein
MADKYKVPAVFGVGLLGSWMGMKDGAGIEWKYSWTYSLALTFSQWRKPDAGKVKFR